MDPRDEIWNGRLNGNKFWTKQDPEEEHKPSPALRAKQILDEKEIPLRDILFALYDSKPKKNNNSILTSEAKLKQWEESLTSIILTIAQKLNLSEDITIALIEEFEIQNKRYNF